LTAKDFAPLRWQASSGDDSSAVAHNGGF